MVQANIKTCKYYSKKNQHKNVLNLVVFFSVKQKLHEMLQTDKDFTSEDEERLNPCHQISIGNALKFIKNPVKCCQQIYDLIQELR